MQTSVIKCEIIWFAPRSTYLAFIAAVVDTSNLARGAVALLGSSVSLWSLYKSFNHVRRKR